MAISKRKNGYTVTVSVPNPAGGRGTRHTLGTWRLRKDAESAERKAKDEIQRGTFTPDPPPPPAKTPTVAEAVDVWLQTKRLSVQDNSATGYESAMRLHVLPALGSIDVTRLTHDGIQRQVNAWRDSGMGARLLHRCVMVLRAALARQVKNGTIPFNPADGLEKPSARTRKSFTIWNDAQRGAFLDESVRDRLAPI